MDRDLQFIQEARNLLHAAHEAYLKFRNFAEEQVERHLARVNDRFGCAEKDQSVLTDLHKINLLSCSGNPSGELMGELVKILEKRDVAPGSSTAVEVRGQKVAVFNVDGTFYAIGDTCTHRAGPLSEGEVSGTTVTCPWHRAQYDLKTGGVLTPPAPESVASYKVVVEGDAVSIEL